jgi:hypothetical protein
MKPLPHWSTLAWLALCPSVLMAFQGDAKPVVDTLGLKPPQGAIVVFNGNNLDGWVQLDGKTPANWPVRDGILTVGNGNIMTQRRFGDFQLHLEFNIPYMPAARGQARGNSGVFRPAATSFRCSIPTSSGSRAMTVARSTSRPMM